MPEYAGKPSVLLVEDNDADVGLFRIVALRTGIDLTLHVSADGLLALESLRSWNDQAQGGSPSLILVDLNMPRLDGRDFLSAVRADDALRDLPVVVLSSSAERKDIDQCLDLGANAYVVKPVDFTDFSAKVNQMLKFWLATCERPPAIGASTAPRTDGRRSQGASS